jgi:hypothetical protein
MVEPCRAESRLVKVTRSSVSTTFCGSCDRGEVGNVAYAVRGCPAWENKQQTNKPIKTNIEYVTQELCKATK